MYSALPSFGIFLTRIGMAGVLVWFGWHQFTDAQSWIGYVPDFATSLSGLSATTIVQVNGGAEIVFGAFLLLGMFTRVAALVMGVHLALIAFSLGNSAVAVRDWGLAFALFGLVLTGAGALALDRDE